MNSGINDLEKLLLSNLYYHFWLSKHLLNHLMFWKKYAFKKNAIKKMLMKESKAYQESHQNYLLKPIKI